MLHIGLDLVGLFPPMTPEQSGATDLTNLNQAQKFAKTLPAIAIALKTAGHVNLATIADCLAQKNSADSREIIARTERVLNTRSSQAVLSGQAPA